jgi:hypothetical protein
MRRTGLLLAAALVGCALFWSTTVSAATIFTETVGNPSATTPIGSYSGWSNPGLTFTGTGDVRNTSPSTGYAGASGQGNVFLTNVAGINFQIAGIDTTVYTSLALSFGVFKSSTASTGSDLIVEVSSDGTNYTALSFAALPTGTGTATWFQRTATGTIPAAANLRIRFRQTATTTQYRIDDVALTGTPQPGSIQFSAATYSVGEAGTSVTLSVTRTGGSAGAATVSYATSGGTAAAGGDYTADAGTLSWADGDSSPKTVSVFVADDNVYEGDETFGVTLSAPSGATLGTPSAATVNVNDNDPTPSVSVGDVTVAEPSSGITYALFNVTLSNPSAFAAAVSYATADGTAVAPDDYAAASGTLDFAAGETTKTVAVIVKADGVLDAGEKFTLVLSGAGGATVADGTGEATVTAPVPPGSVIISEFRLGGPAGPDDEFIELYNNTDEDVTVTDANPVSCAAQLNVLDVTQRCGWALLDVQGQVSSTPRYVVPALTTVIPARGHLLLTGSGYSLSALAAPDFTYPAPAYADSDAGGLALYGTADRAQFATAIPFDAVGFEGAALPYREGGGLLPADGVEPYTGTTYAEHSFVRNQPSSRPADTGDNRADFTLVATNPSQVTGGVAVLGAPGPENKASPVSRNNGFSVGFPPGVASSLRAVSPAVPNGSLGTMSLRRRFTNNTGQALSKLRFRVAQVTTLNSKQVFASQADVRILDAMLTGLPGTFKAAVVETPPTQSSGGGAGTGLLVGGSLTLAQPLQNGESVDVEFLLGVMKGGSYQFILVVEGGP